MPYSGRTEGGVARAFQRVNAAIELENKIESAKETLEQLDRAGADESEKRRWKSELRALESKKKGSLFSKAVRKFTVGFSG